MSTMYCTILCAIITNFNACINFLWKRNLIPRKGGGGGTSMCMHIGYVPRVRPPFSALNFRSGAYHFHKLPFYIFWRILPFRRPSFSKFLQFQPVHRLTRPAQSEAAAPRVSSQLRTPARRVLVVLETSIFTLKTDQARSGAPHFQAQNGSSSFRSPSFSRSTGSSFRSPCPFFTLPWHIPTKIWDEYPPPPPPGLIH